MAPERRYPRHHLDVFLSRLQELQSREVSDADAENMQLSHSLRARGPAFAGTMPKLSNPCCAMTVREMLAAIPYFREQRNSSPSSKRKSANAAAPRILNSSRKNTRSTRGSQI